MSYETVVPVEGVLCINYLKKRGKQVLNECWHANLEYISKDLKIYNHFSTIAASHNNFEIASSQSWADI